MKPLTSETLAKAAIIEGYCWEIAALEVANKNTQGAQYFMGLADSLHRMYELGNDGEEAPRPQEIEGLMRDDLVPTFPHISSRDDPRQPPPAGGLAEMPVRLGRPR